MARPLPDAGRLQERLAGRDQEGVPQARARAPPGQEPRQQGGRGEVQGGQHRPTRRSPTPRSASSTTSSAGSAPSAPGPAAASVRAPAAPRASTRACSARAGVAQFDMGDLGDILGNLFGGAAGGARPRPPQGGRARRRPAGRRHRVVRRRAERRRPCACRSSKADTCETCHGSGAKPGTTPKVCPRVPGPRRGRCATRGRSPCREPCPRCHGQGTIIEDPCPTCRGTGVQSRDPPVQRQGPGGRQGRQQDQHQGQGRGRPPRRPGRRPLRARARRDRRRSSSGAATTSSSRCRSRVAEAALGATVKVPTPGGGRVSLKVPGRQPGRPHAARARQGHAQAQGRPRRPAGRAARARCPASSTRTRSSCSRSSRRRSRTRARRYARTAIERPTGADRGRTEPGACYDSDGQEQKRQTALHDLGGGGAGRHAPADAAPVRAARAGAPAAHGQEHAPLLGARRRAAAAHPGAHRARAQPRRRGARARAWRSSWMSCTARCMALQAQLAEAAEPCAARWSASSAPTGWTWCR